MNEAPNALICHATNGVAESARNAIGERKIGEILLERGLISRAELDAASESQKTSPDGRKLGEILVSMGTLEKADVYSALAEQLDITFLDPLPEDIPSNAKALIDGKFAKEKMLVPIDQKNGTLTIAMANPLDINTIQEIEFRTNLSVDAFLATEEEVIEYINRHYGGEDAMQRLAGELIKMGAEAGTPSRTGAAPMEISSEAEGKPVIRFVNALFANAIKLRASDIHIEPQSGDLAIRYRVDGILRDAAMVPENVQLALISRVKIMSNLDIAIKHAPQDGHIIGKLNGTEYDFRVSTLPTNHGEKIVIRILDRSQSFGGLSETGMPEDVLSRFSEALEQPKGIILVTGPTGSGKSSTLYASLNKLNTGESNIVTVEDPVEYQVSGVNQVQVNPKRGLTFAAGLRSILRQDPDIVMVGEIRDSETAEIAFRAAQTGHLVLSTLHTNDAASAITRLIDIGVPAFLTASSLLGVLAQRLVRRIWDKCKTVADIDTETLHLLQTRDPDGGPWRLYHGVGCEECQGTGYTEGSGCLSISPSQMKSPA